MDFSGKYIFIRFNPDQYRDKHNKIKKTQMVTRLPVLLKKIKKQMKRIENEENSDLLEIHHLYYDGYV